MTNGIELEAISENLDSLASQIVTVEGQLQAAQLTGAASSLREALGRIHSAQKAVGAALAQKRKATK